MLTFTRFKIRTKTVGMQNAELPYEKWYDAARLVLLWLVYSWNVTSYLCTYWYWVTRTIPNDVTEQRPVTFDKIYIGKHRMIDEHFVYKHHTWSLNLGLWICTRFIMASRVSNDILRNSLVLRRHLLQRKYTGMMRFYDLDPNTTF